MATWKADDIANALDLITTGSDFCATGVSIDSRTIKPGELYVAIKGDSLDGHNFVKDAFSKGASGVVVSDLSPDLAGKTYFLVDDTLKALHHLAAYARSKTTAKIVGITGSVGKTTTKEWLAHVLASFGKTTFSKESYNNHWGVPLSLASLENDTDFGVFEIGTNNPGEIAPLSKLVEPDIAVITTIAEGHIGNFSSIDQIAIEKAEIFSGLKAGGTVILNFDNPQFEKLKTSALSKGITTILSVGKSRGADVQLLEYKENSLEYTSSITAEIKGKNLQYQLPLIGEHYAFTSLIVLACVDQLNLSLDKAAKALTTIKPIRGRGLQQKITLLNGISITLIDDAYNANPASMKAGLNVLASLTTKGKKIAVLGEMLELGEKTPEYHRDLVDAIKQAGANLVFGTGAGMQHLFDALPKDLQGNFELKAEALIPYLLPHLQDGDIVFVKGSKGSKVSRIVDYFHAEPTTVAA
ncbi:MAG: UDP-N-acetylmuramoyl-tripeptide--D-alanyl-D-alanine ligase [Alphaproteobacteria bacterium]|nr:UDP-N-acetylmuramoyl-tripeptide--D-alanyl-D-alanine ligase [Alphaproteobacteria bacterium]